MFDLDTLYSDLNIAKIREMFLRELLSELTNSMKEVIGRDDADGFIGVLDERLGESASNEGIAKNGNKFLSVGQIAQTNVDLRKHAGSCFRAANIKPDEITFSNMVCPFVVEGKSHNSLCIITSHVFGRIAANNQGYARVTIEKSILRDSKGCSFKIKFSPKSTVQALLPQTKEYFRT